MADWGSGGSVSAWIAPVESTPSRGHAEEWESGDANTFENADNNDSGFADTDGKLDVSAGEFTGEKLAGNCYNCGQEGHNKADCPEPRVFKGTCRICEKEGHPASQCPEKPADKCRNCGEEGHKIAECKGKRMLDLEKIPDKSSEEAWIDVLKADKERDLSDLREAVQVLQKADRELTYHALEIQFREKGLKTNVIAYEKEITDTFTLMDLDGKIGRQYHVGFYFSAKAPRGSLKDSWPESAEQNLERLQDAGIPVDSKIPKCGNCGELGHISKSCKEEKKEVELLQIKCVNCNEVGHRARDCTQQRIDRFACKNCKQSGHNAKDCPEPRSAEGVTCKNCEEVGHFSRDCPKRVPETCRNCGEEGHRARDCEKPRVVKCRNCDEEGHVSKECPKPRDWSRVKCSNCDEMGHGRGRCPKPVKEETNDDAFGDSTEVPAAMVENDYAGAEPSGEANDGENW